MCNRSYHSDLMASMSSTSLSKGILEDVAKSRRRKTLYLRHLKDVTRFLLISILIYISLEACRYSVDTTNLVVTWK